MQHLAAVERTTARRITNAAARWSARHQQQQQQQRQQRQQRQGHSHKRHAMAQAQGYSWEPWHPDMEGNKRVSPAAERNKEPILQVLRQLLPAATPGSVLEVASGTGQHVAHFAAAFPQLSWQPSDVTAECFDSIRAHAGRRLANVRPPVVLDAAAPAQAWPCQGPLAAVYAANVSHISPWRVTLGLLAGAGQLLQPGGLLCLYGPFKINGAFTSESNESFHHTLRAQDPQWGYRDVADIEAAARGAGLALQRRVDMPANNHLLVFVKQPGASGG